MQKNAMKGAFLGSLVRSKKTAINRHVKLTKRLCTICTNLSIHLMLFEVIPYENMLL